MNGFKTLSCSVWLVILTTALSTQIAAQTTEAPPSDESAASQTEVAEKKNPTASKTSESKVGKKSDENGWPLYRSDAQSTGVARSKLPSDLEVLWEYKVPNGAFEGSAAIVQEIGDPGKKTVYIGDLDGKLFALDLETGKPRWEFKSESEIGFLTSPAVRDGKIYIGDIDGMIYCVDEAGQKVWNFQTDGEINSSANFYKDDVLVGSQDFHLYALNIQSGKLSWKYESADQIRCSATVAGNRAFVAGCDGYFHVVDLDTGKEAGNTDIRSPTGATPAAMGDHVFFGTEQGDFFAVNWKEIKNQWVYEDEVGGNSIRSCAAVSKNHVVFGARNRQVYSLNPKNGEVNWTARLKAKVDSSPIIVGDRVFAASTDGRLYSLDLKDGTTVWEKQFNGGFLSSPAVAFERLVIATDRGVVYCLGKK